MVGLLIVLIMTSATGHPVVVFPAGGENFQAGENITLKWRIAIDHEQENWDLYFSPDGGETWEIIVLDINPEVLEYSWTLPDVATNTAKFRIVMDNAAGIMDYEDISNSFTIMAGNDITAIGENPQITLKLTNSPNPFRTGTTISFTLEKSTNVSLVIFNISGAEIQKLVDNYLKAGMYEYTWEGTGNSSGIYFCRLATGDIISVCRMMLIR